MIVSTLAWRWTQKSTCTVHWTFPRTTTMAGMTDMWCIRLTLVSCSTSICRAFDLYPPVIKENKNEKTRKKKHDDRRTKGMKRQTQNNSRSKAAETAKGRIPLKKYNNDDCERKGACTKRGEM